MGLLKRFKSSLTYPIALTLVLVTVVPVALSGWLFASYNREHLTTVEKLYLNRQAVSLAREVDHFLTSRQTYLESTARALAISADNDVVSFESYLEEMATEAGPSFAYLQILNRDGEGSYVYDPELGAGEVELLSSLVRGTQESALAGEPSPEFRLEVTAERSPWAILVYPLETPDEGAWGSLAGVVDFGDLERGFGGAAFTGLNVNVIDDTGTVVLSSTPSLRGESLASSPLVRDFLTRPLALTSTYTTPLIPDAGEVLGSAAPVASLGWGVVLERPTSIAFAPVRVMQQRTLMVSAIAGLVALALGSQVAGWLLIAYAMPRLPAVETSVMLLLQPMATVLWGYVLFAEDLSVVQWLGVLLVLSGVAVPALIVGRLRRSGVGVAPKRG